MAVSPQLEKYSKQVAKKHHLSIPVLCDKGNKVARQFGLVHGFSDDLRKVYESLGLDIPRFNGDDSWTLPLPGRFVIARDGIVFDAQSHPDYTRRPEPADIVGILESMRYRE